MKRTKSAQRQAALRARGKTVTIVLRDHGAIKALEIFSVRFGSYRLAIETALHVLINQEEKP